MKANINPSTREEILFGVHDSLLLFELLFG